MKKHLKLFNTIVALAIIGAFLPSAAFAQIKTVTTVTSPTQTTQFNAVTGISAPTGGQAAPATSPTQSVTTDTLFKTSIVAPTTQTKTTQILSPTTGIVAPTTQPQMTKALAPATGVVAPTSPTLVAPTKTAAPTGSVAPQKTTTAFPFTPTAAPRSSDALTTVSQYAAAQVIYPAERIDLLLKVAEQRGEASALPLPLEQFPGNPTIAIEATADGEFVVDVAGTGRYSVNATVYDIDRNALAQFSGVSFVVPWTTYDDPVSFVVNIAYLPAATLTFVGGFPLPSPTGVTPITPTTLTTPVKPAVQSVTPIAPGVPSKEVYELTYSLVAIVSAPVEGGVVREIPRGEEPEEIISEEGEAFEPIAEEDIPEEEFELSEEFLEPEVPELVEEPGIVERIGGGIARGARAVGDFISDFFGSEAAPEEGVAEEVAVEGEITFADDEGEEGEDTDFFGVSDGGEEDEEFFEGEPDEFFAFEGEPEELGFDFTDFGVSRDEFAEEEAVGDLDFGFDFGDLALLSEEEFIGAEDELFGAAGEDELVFGEEGEEFPEGEPSFAEATEGEEGEDVDFFGVSDEGKEEGEDLFVGDLDIYFGGLTLAPADEFVPEEEEFVAEEAQLFTSDESAPVVPGVVVVDGNVNVQFSLDGLFEFGETPLVVSLGFASGAKQLTFSNPIDSDLAATFTVSTAVLSSLGSSDLDVLLTLQSAINGLTTVDTYVLGSIKL